MTGVFESIGFDNIEMSKMDPMLPRYYKNFDIDNILAKMKNDEQITEEEQSVYVEVWDIYYKKEFEKRQKTWDEKVKNYKGKYPIKKFIDHIPNF